MAYLNLVGFDTGDAVQASDTAGAWSVQSAVTRGAWSAYALRVNPAGAGTGRYVLATWAAQGFIAGASAATAFCRFYFRFDVKPASGDEELCSAWTGASAAKLTLRLTSAGRLAAYDSANTLLATGATVLSSGAWYRIEVKCGTGASSTAWEVKVDGAVEMGGTAANLRTQNNAAFALGKITNRSGNSVDFYYDDVAYSDSDYPGDGRTTLLRPNAAGAFQTWSRGGANSGSNWGQVDEAPHNSDADYLLSTGVAGDAETERCGPASGVGSVNGVLGLAVVRDNGVTGNVQVRVRSGGVNSDALGTSTLASYGALGRLLDADPATGSAWAASAVNAAEVGAVEGSSNPSRMTACYLVVDYVPGAAPVARVCPGAVGSSGRAGARGSSGHASAGGASGRREAHAASPGEP